MAQSQPLRHIDKSICYKKSPRLVFSLFEAQLLVEREEKNAKIDDFFCKYGMPDTIRTYDLQLRKLTLYPTELRAHMWIASASADYYSTVQRLKDHRAKTFFHVISHIIAHFLKR